MKGALRQPPLFRISIMPEGTFLHEFPQWLESVVPSALQALAEKEPFLKLSYSVALSPMYGGKTTTRFPLLAL